MQQSLPSRLLGHYEYEIKLPIQKNNNVKRRTTQIIQANLNTTIMEMSEEVCKRQGYDIKEYELCFEGKRLEPSAMLRHSGLPVHGILDFILKSDIPKEILVNVGLQLASGKRLTNKFRVEDTLWSILEYWESKGEKIFQAEDITDGPPLVPVCNFLRQTVVGKEQLQEKTLRSLDLTRGSGIIRFFYRAEDQLGKQANVSSSLSRPSNSKLVEEYTHMPTPQTHQPSRTNNLSSQLGRLVDSSTPQHEVLSHNPIVKHIIEEDARLEPDIDQVTDDTVAPTLKLDKEEQEHVNVVPVSRSVNGASNEDPPDEEEKMDCSEKVLQFASPGQVFVLGENNAMLYHGDDVSLKVDDEPDDFYAVTAKDVESIYRELKAKRAEMEEAPLLTSNLRNIDESSANERMLREHPSTTVRIRFPDRFVLQGSFTTTDSVSSLNDFVRRYLNNPSCQFYLFTAPPKTVLDEAKTLLQQNLLGLAIVYFGCDASQQEKYLKEEFYSQVSDPHEVFKYSSLTSGSVSSTTVTSSGPGGLARSGSENNSQLSSTHEQSPSSSSSSRPNRSSTSGSAGPSSSARINRSNADSSGSVPKWFKPSTK